MFLEFFHYFDFRNACMSNCTCVSHVLLFFFFIFFISLASEMHTIAHTCISHVFFILIFILIPPKTCVQEIVHAFLIFIFSCTCIY